ncbi:MULTISPECIES: hypothetical protein [Priestia]|uniref:Uncharacterized protein n=1 Tax=Priestia megaterium (strain WSH-002) TaxID=1006007 RepID=A0A8D3WZT3_PRIMW|nr:MULTISPECIES: hypothetical protein [Priestia]AEN89683.1 hypothetical protein BMWSH_2801 [Priestia megaterium WSH-002]
MDIKLRKKLIAQAMQSLEQAVFQQDLALMFEYEAELARLTNGAFSPAFLMELTNSNTGTGNVLINVFLNDIFREVE